MDQIRKSTENNRWPGTIVSLSLLVSIFLIIGCAPKKVVNSKSDAPKTVAANSGQARDLEMPQPSAVGKSGLEPGKNTGSQNTLPADTAQGAGKNSNVGLKAAALARKQLGKQYQWGAEGPDKFDCSGLALYVYKELGYQLPHSSRSQAKNGKAVSRKEMRPGDLVFFCTSGKVINHVGIYVGDNKFIHAPRKHKPVSVGDLNNAWWRQRLKAIRRVG